VLCLLLFKTVRIPKSSFKTVRIEYISLFLPYLSKSDLLMRRRANGSITVMLIVFSTNLGGFARTLLFWDVLEVTMDSHDARRPSWRRLFGTIRPYLRMRGKSLFAPSCQQAMHLRDRNTVNPFAGENLFTPILSSCLSAVHLKPRVRKKNVLWPCSGQIQS
jgi:hypothetical protein